MDTNKRIIEAAHNSFASYCQVVDPKYQVSWHHAAIAKALEDAVEAVEQGKKYRLIIELPPRHGKSHTATTLFPPWVLGKHPDWPFIVTSYSADLAQSFGMKARDVIQSNPHYPLIFPQTRIRSDSKAKDKWMTEQGGSYSSVGVGGSITGFGAKIAIIDDPIKNSEEARSQALRDKIWDWYTSTLYTRLEGEGAIIIIMTRWHLDDLVGRVLGEYDTDFVREHKDEWKVVRFPAIAEEDEEHRKKGEALWPEKFPLSTLNNIKANIDVTDWAALYQQRPVLAENAEFNKHDFRYYDESDIRGKYLRYTTTVDPATGSKRGDNTVVTTVGKEVNGPNWYVIEEDAGKFDPQVTTDLVFKHQAKYRSEVFIEAVAYQKMLKWYIEEEQRRRQQYFIVNELKRNTNSSKETRIRGLIPLFRSGVILLRSSMQELVSEAMQFPLGKHDDRIDNLANQLEAVDNTREKFGPKVFKRKFTGYFRSK